MSEMPERIWADDEGQWQDHPPLAGSFVRSSAYVRADIRNAEIKELEQKQEGTEEAMHQRIRATYDKAVAECWRSKVKELVDALQWYVDEDDVIEEEGNEYWLEGRERARALVSKYRGDA